MGEYRKGIDDLEDAGQGEGEEETDEDRADDGYEEAEE